MQIYTLPNSVTALSYVEAIGLIGLVLVFASFIIRNWVWLYALNLSGALMLAVYAFLVGNTIFLILQCGIALLLTYRLIIIIKKRNQREIN